MAGPEEIVICGLDGVLALVEHRLHHLHNEEGRRDWDAFNAACVDDMPNLPLIHRLNQAREEGVPVILVTGRSSDVRRQTEQWLHRWQIGYDGLWMRPPGNRLGAARFKAEIIEQHYAGVNIRRVYESAHHLDVARWCTDHNIACTLFGPNQGNGEDRELFDLKTVRHACDHVMLYPFYGDDDYSWEDRCAQLAQGACLLCQADEAAAEREQKAVEARLAARERGLPPLEGSDRQVAWAEGIRLTAFSAIDKVNKWVKENNAQAEQEDPDYWHSVKQGIARATTYLEEQVEAKWWIDHRHGIMNSLDGGRSLLSAVAEQQGYF
ncbi:MAG: hypothetical protein P8Y64_06690 [Gammaproteobacteria bacterium]|jgi:hypothetical protein